MNILDNYPVFENNQVLTSDQLNNLVKYLDQQNRLTRAQLIGIGNVCGFHVKYNTTESALTISKGVGITSEGFLLEQGDCSTRWYRKYDYTKSNISYPPFEDITDKNHSLDVELFELLSTTTDPANEFKLTEKFLSDKVVLLFLEIFDQDLKTCLAKSCDEIGQTRIFTIRKLLISIKDMDRVLQRLDIDSYDPTFPDKFGFPVITIPRVNIKPDEAAAKDKTLLLKKYKDSVEEVKNGLFDAIKQTYKVYNPILKDLYEKDYFGNGKIIDKKILEWETYLDGDSYGVQYFYDFIKDLTLAYDEFKNTAFELCNECLIDMERFPLHLMLGLAVPDKEYNIDSTHYRNRFIHSPAYSIQKYLTQKTRSLHQRIVSMMISFDLEYISKTDNKIKDLHVTPSHEKLSKLSNRSIPFYYYPDNKDIPLIDFWNFDIEKRKKTDYILSYHHLKNTYPLEVRNALKYDIDKYSFLRLEGLLGKDVEIIKSTLEQQKKDYNLSFKVVSLQINPLASELTLDPSLWCDLDLLYFNARLAYLDVFQKLSYDIKIIKSYSLPLRFTSIDIDATQKLIDDTIKNLPEKINEFIFPDFFKNYCILLELLQVYKINILHYQGRLIHELINVTSKDDFQKGIIQINTSLSLIQKILDFGVYKELYLLFYRLNSRKQELKENHPSIFANFLKANPGLNHEGGAKNDGTIVLVSELDETDKKFKVFADFTLPYLCCCDCNDIPCTDDEIEYSQLPHLALPDGVLCEINLPAEIEILNNDYILSNSNLTLSSKSPLVKCDQPKKIITYKRDDDFTGIDTFTYTLERKVLKEDEEAQPKAAKKKKIYSDVDKEPLSSANVKVLIHNKYTPHIQAIEDFQIITQHEELIIDVLSNDIAYNTTKLKLPAPTTPLEGKVEIITQSGKDFIKYTPKRAGKDSFNYQLVDEKRAEQSEATVSVFVTKLDLSTSDIVFLVTTTGINYIPITLPVGGSISGVPSLPNGMGTLAIDPSKTSIQFTPGSAFIDNKTLKFNYQLTNDKGESIKGVVHLVNALTEFTIPDIVYRVTKKVGNLIPVDYATLNGLSIENTLTTNPSNIGTLSVDNVNHKINFIPNANFSNFNTSKIVYSLKNSLGFLTKGVIHLVNGLKENPIPDIIFQVTAFGRITIPVSYATQNNLNITSIISNISSDAGTISYESKNILFDTGANYKNQNTLSFSYVLSQSDGETMVGNAYLINSIKEEQNFKDFFDNLMAGSIMAFAFDVTKHYDLKISSLGTNASKVIEFISFETGLKNEDVKTLLASLPATIKGINYSAALKSADTIKYYGGACEIVNWLNPFDWLICDGSAYSRTRFERLFQRIGVLYGVGDGKNTFNVPDLRNQFLRGWDDKPENIRTIGSYQNDQIQSHRHIDAGHIHTDIGHTHIDEGHAHNTYHLNGSSPGGNGAELTASSHWGNWSPNFAASAILRASSANIQTGYSSLGNPEDSKSGAGTPRHGSETRPKNMAVLFCIKY